MGSVCKMPVGEDSAFAKKSVVAWKNRYKDKYPCKFKIIVSLIISAKCSQIVDKIKIILFAFRFSILPCTCSFFLML